jgi:hypothetical protein
VVDLLLRSLRQQAVQGAELSELPKRTPELRLEDDEEREHREGEHR